MLPDGEYRKGKHNASTARESYSPIVTCASQMHLPPQSSTSAASASWGLLAPAASPFTDTATVAYIITIKAQAAVSVPKSGPSSKSNHTTGAQHQRAVKYTAGGAGAVNENTQRK